MPKVTPDIIIPELSVDRKNKIPIYQQLYGGIQSLIINGRLRPRDRLPSSRALAGDLGISRNIVLLAYEQLALEGYIISGIGTGSFVADNIAELFTSPKISVQVKEKVKTNLKETIRFNYPLPDSFIRRESTKGEVLPFGNAIPALDEFPYKAWVKCAYKVLRGFEFLHLSYDDPQGYYDLRVSLANYLRTNRALHCEPDQIIITAGAQQGLTLIANLLVTKKDSFWMEDPGYGNAKAAFMQRGARPCFIPLTENGIDLDWAIRYYPKATMAYVTPSHQFPLGGTLPVSKRIQLLNWAGKNNMWIIEDDYDSEFRYANKPIPSLQGLDQYKKVIYLGTCSKVIFPALRIGYIVLPSCELARTFSKGKAFLDRQNAITDQAILNEFIKDGYFLIHLRKMRVLYKKRQDYLVYLIGKYGKDLIRAESQNSGMHIIVWLPEKVNDQALASFLRQGKITVTAVSMYSAKFKAKPGLILGYTAFNEKKLKASCLFMIEKINVYLRNN